MIEANENVETKKFRASDILKAAGLTYRQLNDWENRAGVLTADRAITKGWRKFTFGEVLALCICSAIRKQFSPPLSQIAKLYQWLLGNRVSDIYKDIYVIAEHKVKDLEKTTESLRGLDKAAWQEAMKNDSNRHMMNQYMTFKLALLITEPVREAHKLTQLGLRVYLYTDFDTSLIMSELRLIDWIAERNPDAPAIICPLNDIINQLRVKSKLKPFDLSSHSIAFWKEWSAFRQREKLSAEEEIIVRIIRAKDYQKITVSVRNGKIIRADIEEELPKEKLKSLENEIIEIINAKTYHRITIDIGDGKFVRLNIRTSVKFS